MAKQIRERRKHERKPVHVRIRYRVVDQFLEDYIKNISLGGIFVATSDPLPVRTRLKIQFSLPGMKSLLETEGVVVHTMGGGRGRRSAEVSGMGIKFSDLSPEAKKAIEAYIGRGTLS